jgi:hypothetical protein
MVRRDGSPKFEPVCRVIVRCRKEDLDIQKIEVKKNDRFLGIAVNNGIPNRLAAAEAYIRTALSSKDLNVKNYNDPFGEITLAESVVYVGE